MTLLNGYDAVNWTSIPGDAQFVFLYNDGLYAAPVSAYQHFEAAGARIATICVEPTTVANVLDVEPGNIVTAQAPEKYCAWLDMMKNDYGYVGVIYCDQSDQGVIAANLGGRQVLWSLAILGQQPQTLPSEPAGVVNVQWAFESNLDRDAVSPDFPSIGPKLQPGQSAQPAPAPVPDVTDTPQYRSRHNTCTPVAVDGDFGPDTCKAVQYVLGVSVDGVFGPVTCEALQGYLQVAQDGDFGTQSIRALQEHVGVTQDGIWGAATTTGMQNALNEGVF
jgi:peptidoglycan hydrolase-like protein with peptidoglycan-binding domain